MLKVERAVHVVDVCAKKFPPRDFASPQVHLVVDDGEQGLLDLFLDVPHHGLGKNKVVSMKKLRFGCGRCSRH